MSNNAHPIGVLKNPIQNYAWGSHTILAELLGKTSPASEPEAELWMGAHPIAPSSVLIDGQWIPLPEWIASAPDAILGHAICRRFNSRLPYLFKVLAIAKPLSIQAHPNQTPIIERITESVTNKSVRVWAASANNILELRRFPARVSRITTPRFTGNVSAIRPKVNQVISGSEPLSNRSNTF
jgi:hypothetical protein